MIPTFVRPGAIATVAVAIFLAVACGDDLDRPTGPGGEFRAAIAVDSDPPGGRIFLNGEDSERVTPDTLQEVEEGPHDVSIVLDTLGWEYSIGARVQAIADTVIAVRGPLVTRCLSLSCVRGDRRGGLDIAVRPIPSLFYVEGQGEGVRWPVGTGNSYASTGTPVLAGIVGTGEGAGDTIAVGPYDHRYFAGRPAPEIGSGADTGIRVPAWLLPPRSVIASGRSAPRGLEVVSTLTPGSAVGIDDLVYVRFVLRNISDSTLYRSVDPIPEAGRGLDLVELWPGFALDFDIGISEDDMVTYVPDEDLAIGYDSDFSEEEYGSGWSTRPALVGLRMVEAPPEASRVTLNAWQRNLDWSADETNESFGLLWLSADEGAAVDHPDPRIGVAPDSAADYRMSVATGPLALAPGDSIAYTVAVLLAEPVPGTFTSGTVVSPGDPADGGRAIVGVADALIRKAREAKAAWDGPGGPER